LLQNKLPGKLSNGQNYFIQEILYCILPLKQ
jgi:hypothetical protein